jgi:methionyl-tRNA formyltransferase
MLRGGSVEGVIGSRPFDLRSSSPAETKANMNAKRTSAARGTWFLRETPSPYDAQAPPAKTRVAVFGSFMGGYHVLREFLSEPLAQRVTVVGVATDDPTQEFTHASVRLWKYPHERADEMIVPQFAAEHGLPVFMGRVKTPEFYQRFLDEWQPQLCLMATFGQKIPDALIARPELGFYNFHHSGETWPSYPGPDPIAALVRDGRKHLVLTIHKVTHVIDGGEFVAHSHRVAIPEGINAIGMHRITWPQMGPFIRREIGAMIDGANAMPASAPLVLQEEAVAYRPISHREWAERIAA